METTPLCPHSPYSSSKAVSYTHLPDGSGQQLTAAAKDGTLRTAPGQTVQVLCRLENGGFGTGHNTVCLLYTSRCV